MNAASLIKAQAAETRRYSTKYNYVPTVERILAGYRRIHPHTSFDDSMVVRSTIPNPNDEPYSTRDFFDAKHAIVEGPADTSLIERELGIEVPACLQEFYSQIHECLLLLRYPVRIYSPGTLVALEKEIRQFEAEDGGPEAEGVSLLRFISIPGFAASFALRRFLSDGKWRVVLYSEGYTDELQRDDDQWQKQDIEEFDDWTRRILQSDGEPLILDNPYIFEPVLADRVG